MNQDKIKGQLKQEGYTEIYLWKDPPHKVYTPHSHNTETKLIVMKGEIEITANNMKKTYHLRDSIIIPKRGKHSAIVGPEGCEYLIGEK